MKKSAAPKPLCKTTFDVAKIEAAMRAMLDALAIEHDELSGTAKRVAGMWSTELLERHLREPHELVKRTVKTKAKHLFLIGPIYTHAVCPHHVLPCDVIAHVGFVPDGVTAGLSSLAELVAMSCRRFALIEDLASDVAADIEAVLRPKGIAVHLSSRHGCVAFRGTQRKEVLFDAQAFTGVCDTVAGRREFLASLKR